MNNETDKYIIATVETALDVLEAISAFSNGFTSKYPPSLRTADIAGLVKLASRIL